MTKATSDSQLKKWRNKFGGISLWPAPVLGTVLLQFLMAFPGPGYGSGANPVREVHARTSHQVNVGCDRLLAATTQAMIYDATVHRITVENAMLLGIQMGTHDLTLSGTAQIFLNLIDIGMANLGPELPKFLLNLQLITQSDHSRNPFLNLNSPLALALSHRAEPLLRELDADWESVTQVISLRIEIGAGEQSQRLQDQQETRTVLTPIDLPNPWARFGLKDEEGFSYIGETAEALIFSVNTALAEGVEGSAPIILRLSKHTREGSIVSRILPLKNTDSYPRKFWMHKGLVYGFGYREEARTQNEIRAPQIFRVDPETSVLEWADQWAKLERDRFPSRFLYRLHVSNSVIGVDWCKDGAHIYRFDYDQFRMIPTGLVCTDPDEGRGARWERQKYFSSGRYLNGPLRLGRVFMTDGQVLVKAGDSWAWKHWSPHEAFVFEKSQYRNGKYVWNQTTISLYETKFDFETIDLESNKEKTAREPIVFSVPIVHSDYSNASMYEAFESVDGGRSLVYLLTPGSFGSRFPPKLLLIDRQTWTANEIELTGGRFADEQGVWRLLRNQSDDVLLQFVRDQEVALWKFDSVTRKFELKVHEVFHNPEDYEGLEALLDYEKLRFIAWSYWTRKKPSRLHVRALLPVNLAREQSPQQVEAQ